MSTTQRVVRKQLAGAEDLLQGVGTVTQTRGTGTYPIHKLDIPIPTYDIAEMQASSAEFMRLYGSDTAYTDYRRNPEGTIGIPSNLGGVWEPMRSSEYLVCGNFATGAYVFSSDCVVALDQQSYNWQGSVPKVVAAGATPATSGGIGVGAWVDRTGVALGAELVGYQPAGTGAVATTVQSKLREFVSVKDFGAVGDGVADDSGAFQAAIAYANSIALPVIPGNNSRTGLLQIHIPAGQYRITQPIIRSTDFSARTAGMVFEGSGNYLTTINYEPSGADPLFYNNDKVLFLRFNGMRFYANSASHDFFYSVSDGGAQDYRFNDCTWGGTWRYGFNLKGTNTNSEFSFEKCSFIGVWTVFLFSQDSDQFLNYWFTECKYWCSSPWMKMTKGGNVKISNCDVSGYYPSSETYLFSLEGITHAQGVCSFVCHATRFELKNTNAKIIYSEWPQGNILFSGCDTESQSPFVSPFNTALFRFINVPGPVIQWINCSLMGTHTYSANGASNQFNFIPRISYDNCVITQFQKPEEFLIRTHTINYGGRPVARFYNCRGNGGSGTYEVFDSDQGWFDASRSLTSRKIVRVGGPNQAGPLSGGTETVRLPLNSVIIRVWLVNPAGSTTNSGAYNFVMRTNEVTPTVLGQATGTSLAAGFSVINDLFFRCNTEERRTINVVDLQNITNIGANYFLIEYIG